MSFEHFTLANEPAIRLGFFFGALAVPLAVIILDFVIWFQHVMLHAVPTLWRLHHADPDFDVTTVIAVAYTVWSERNNLAQGIGRIPHGCRCCCGLKSGWRHPM